MPTSSAAGLPAADDRRDSPALRDWTDVIFFAGLALLPVDGTRFGFAMPYWTPISPMLFLVYTLLNACLHPRITSRTVRRFIPFIGFAGLLVMISIFDWPTVGIRPRQAGVTAVAVATGLSTLLALDIARNGKHLNVRTMVTTLIAAYSAAFVVGVIQFANQLDHLNIQAIHRFFFNVIERPYFAVRPQFLFAEPSYIGVHLFGILMPSYWLTRDKRLPWLILGFAGGAIAMQSGRRIIIDTVVCMVIWFVATFRFQRTKRSIAATIGAGATAITAAVAAFTLQPQLRAIAAQGAMSGDFSTSSRMFLTLAPMLAGMHDPVHWLFGFGAGNLADAIRRGFPYAAEYYESRGVALNSEIRLLANPPADTFTMSFFTTFVAEFGLVALAVLFALIVAWVTRNHAWNRHTVCWLVLLAYLYCQFEAYAFAAFWLFIWAVGTDNERSLGTESQIHGRHDSLPQNHGTELLKSQY
ncbi:hypothetical protein GFD17_00905 [Bifidobacterium sp. SMB2]|uniref:Uncharacterized protein n=1 Tax=Bifidobacterium saimiriisciurei TaxID=2661627 RepID=A0ABX0CFQ1_9BIFI|nr:MULTISPECIES: hypothetical protein [Bifidobacterium]NEG95338.1 hypothetical protein [Bifidobacterium sp. SMB2]NEH11478.1 hypothetical protein [Bifidobacterium saimiriisciurei]